MVNNIFNVRGFKFHKELFISHHTQFLDKGGFVSQLLISEAVTFHCKFQAVEKIVISGIAEHFYVVALLVTDPGVYATAVNTYFTMSFLLPRALLWYLANRFVNICLQIPVIWGNISEWVLGDIFHICRVHLRRATNTDSISLRSHSVTPKNERQ